MFLYSLASIITGLYSVELDAVRLYNSCVKAVCLYEAVSRRLVLKLCVCLCDCVTVSRVQAVCLCLCHGESCSGCVSVSVSR